MNRNEVLKMAIRRTLGYAVQGFVYSKIASAIKPQSAMVIKTTSKYGTKLIRITFEQILKAKQSSRMLFM